MNLALDIGNTATKWATFEESEMTGHGYGTPTEQLSAASRALACVSGHYAGGLAIDILDSDTPLPIALNYKTPKTLGADRIANVCGAWALHPGSASLVIDAGTCITVDFVDGGGTYHGGAIMPGLRMNLQALHNFTEKLPLIDITESTKVTILGRSTEESIVSGTLGATMLALAGYVTLYKEKAGELHVLLTGGDAATLANAGATSWEHVEWLTMIGLNEIMRYHED